ncbi:MAG: PQQ-dependent sugar dehydrogenase [Candidatus Saccharibacteria bacterium]|nr:PQQ-dependent sugar dehydrogenase [Candidatus Saccharibacteria bacterium]
MGKLKNVLLVLGLVILLAGIGWYFSREWLMQQFFSPSDSATTEGVSEVSDRQQSEIEVIATSLDVPWEVLQLPSGDLLVTERSGNLVRIGQGEQRYKIDGVAHRGEGGLLGMALHPEFEGNQQIYLYMTTETAGGLTNRVERYKYNENGLSERTSILEGIPGASYHDGGRIAFGPDGYLYITTGDAGDTALAQSTSSLAGKILRVDENGEIPDDNPFGNAVHSYGHRNPQGIAWDDQGRMWSSEHGRSGRLSGMDELNLIERGVNYGWPVIEGDETREGMQAPVIHSGSDVTWAPASLTYWDGSLFFGGLRGVTLYEARLGEGESVDLQAHLRDEYGRIRAVTVIYNDQLYITTSNTDGRGVERSGDDKLIRISGGVFRD